MENSSATIRLGSDETAKETGSAVLELHQLIFPPLPHPCSLTLFAGEEIILVTPRQGISRSLLHLLAGVRQPSAGTVSLFGRSWSELTPREAQEFRRRLALIHAAGGLIANLKVWENLLLPLTFHGRFAKEKLFDLGEEALRRVGYGGDRQAPPDRLTPAEQKSVELARAILMNPELIIYDSPQQGMTRGELQRFLRVSTELHRERPGRASLYLTAERSLISLLPGVRVFQLPEGIDL